MAQAAPSRVLARKYRPTHFGELIGQAPMVRTLKNAFAHERIPQAWMLTGVRGVGKTTTARILARALNHQLEGAEPKPTVDLETPGIHCQAIMEGRHVDVIEMDAASHTGINDIREITDAARYKPVSALYKVYIIDEVHMLSTAAFNGLLKTLEEPPEHVKFIFATTEIRKVPVTVLSRCQRFDLRRIETTELAAHLAHVAKAEGVDASDDALRLVARAAEGSVRDALSIFDQAISHGAGSVTADTLREMLGLADRTRVVDLFEAVMKGDPAAALAELSAQYEIGADPYVVLSDLAAFTHEVTRRKVTGVDADPGEVQEVRERASAFAAGLSMAALSRVWQALMAGLGEVQAAPKPITAAEMVLIRLAYMAGLPDPGLPLTEPAGTTRTPARGAATAPAAAPAAPSAMAPAEPPRAKSGPAAAHRTLTSLRDVADLLAEHSIRLKHAVERDMREKRVEPGRIEVTLEDGAAPTLAGDLGLKLTELTGQRWVVTLSEGATTETLHAIRLREEAEAKAAAREEPLVKALLTQFADAEITAVRQNKKPAEAPATDPTRRANGDHT